LLRYRQQRAVYPNLLYQLHLFTRLTSYLHKISLFVVQNDARRYYSFFFLVTNEKQEIEHPHHKLIKRVDFFTIDLSEEQ
jgi:hypothetical protein